MESIFHEQQDGSLCAQHCLNALLQGAIFTAVELGEIASAMDTAEHEQMAAFGVETEDYRQFVQQGSSNMDDSGFFSVQVLSQALGVWDLELVPLSKRDHPIAQLARDDPTAVQAYICNFREHWFTIRRLGNQWFNLNSLLSGPELISESYLSLLLAQLRQEGYTIFLVVGGLPPCEADRVLAVTPAVQRERPRLLRGPAGRKTKQPHSGPTDPSGSGPHQAAPAARAEDDDDAEAAAAAAAADEDDDLRRALEISRRLHDSHDVSLQRALTETRPAGSVGASDVADVDDEDAELQRVLELSRAAAADDEELRQALALSLMQEGDETLQRPPPPPQEVATGAGGSGAGGAAAAAAPEDLRQRRAKFLERLENAPPASSDDR